VDLQWCLQQIGGWQTACRKLPFWAMDGNGEARVDVWFPPRISMEQCSSQETAQYKAQVAVRVMGGEANCDEMVDLTGGYGVDFSFMARHFRHATYVEKQPHLCEIMRHNIPVLGLENVDVVNGDCADFLRRELRSDVRRLIFADPARRDNVGRKVVALRDCTPDLVELQDVLLERAGVVIVKLSPMLDISMALRSLRGVAEVHVISVRGECKELLLVMTGEAVPYPTLHCVNIADETDVFRHKGPVGAPEIAGGVMQYLYEPNASILKAGVQDALCGEYGVGKLHAMSNLFTGVERVEDFPGRCFRVVATSSFGKRDLREMLKGVSQANIAIRNFPASVDELRRRLKLKDGGDVYLFATTVADGGHVLIRGIRE
jgi:16S rRNA G966 N2-methylase RsmD